MEGFCFAQFEALHVIWSKFFLFVKFHCNQHKVAQMFKILLFDFASKPKVSNHIMSHSRRVVNANCIKTESTPFSFWFIENAASLFLFYLEHFVYGFVFMGYLQFCCILIWFIRQTRQTNTLVQFKRWW